VPVWSVAGFFHDENVMRGGTPKGDAIARADPALQLVYARLLKADQVLGSVVEERGEGSVLLLSRGAFLGRTA